MNKIEIIKKLGISDTDKENKIKRLFDLLVRVNKEYIIQATDFLSPDLLGYIKTLFWNFRDLDYFFIGGYDEAEYVKLIIYPDYILAEELDFNNYISVIDIKYNTKYGEIGHRDVLGSLMGLGIKREKIGDILIHEGRAQVFVDPDLADYISINLDKVGRININTEVVKLDQVIQKEYDIKIISTTVKSLRLDSIIASGYNISRSIANELIKQEKVKVNHSFVKSTSKEIKEKDLISVKGKGRIILDEIGNLSKKERYRVSIKRFL